MKLFISLRFDLTIRMCYFAFMTIHIEELLDDWEGRVKLYTNPMCDYETLLSGARLMSNMRLDRKHLNYYDWKQCLDSILSAKHSDQQIFSIIHESQVYKNILDQTFYELSPYHPKNQDGVRFDAAGVEETLKLILKSCGLDESTDNMFLSGGSLSSFISLRSNLAGQKNIKDFDIFLKDKEKALKFVNQFLSVFNPDDSGLKLTAEISDEGIKINGLKGIYVHGQVLTKKSKIRVVLSSNAITFETKYNHDLDEPIADTQIVLSYINEPASISSRFDFHHSMHTYDFASKELLIEPKGIESMRQNSLSFNQKSLAPFNSLVRAMKFQKEDWTLSKLETLKMCLSIAKLDLTKKEVLLKNLKSMYQVDGCAAEDAWKKIESFGETLSMDEIFEVVSIFDEN